MQNTETQAAPRNTEEKLVGPPITHGGTDRRYKLCKCSICGVVEQCTPMCDFYTRTEDTTGPLLCEVCILRPNSGVTGVTTNGRNVK